MSGSTKQFRFRKGATIGALAAEQDSHFLKECFVEVGALNAILDMNDHRRIILGRTGSGKSALFIHVSEQVQTITIHPDELALDHLSNSELLMQLHECGISLLPLYKLLWKHVFVIEVLRFRHEQLRDSAKGPSFWRNLLNSFSTNAQDQSQKDALDYLSQYGDKFWLTTEYRVKEVTEKVEHQIEAQLGAQIGRTKIGARGSQDMIEERKAALEHIGREFVRAIQIKKLNEAIRWLGRDIAGQPPLFIIIDGLDEDWANAELRFQLIRALIDTTKEFKAVRNLKILVALRYDLFEMVLDHAAEPGFQREKYTQLCYEQRWNREELKSLVESRVNKLVRESYTTARVRIEDLMEEIGGAPGVQYLIDRTLYRPRDLIAFFNQCINQLSDNPRITRQAVLSAEQPYSVARLAAVADEWSSTEPLVLQAAEILRRRKSHFRVRDITNDEVRDFCQSLYLQHWHRGSEISEAARLHCESPETVPPEAVRRTFLNLFYKVGLIGVKPVAQEKYQWAIDGPVAIDHLEITDNCGIRIHKAFWRGLNIVASNSSRDDAA